MTKKQEVLKALGYPEYLYFIIPAYGSNSKSDFFDERIDTISNKIEFEVDNRYWTEDDDIIPSGYNEWLEKWPQEMYGI